MSDPEKADPSNLEPSPDATLRLRTGLPEDPGQTQRLELPKHLTAHETQKLPLPELPGDPRQTQKLPMSPGGDPPIRLQKVDQPAGAEGQTLKLVLRPQAPRRSRWLLPVGLAGLLVLAAAAYGLRSRQPSPQTPGEPGVGMTQGGGTEPVPPAAQVYLEQAQAGDAHAMRMLGAMYYYGLNVPQDRDKGLYWYRKAAEKGSDAARAELSKLEGGR
jgi:TPR repeat protein